MATFEYLPIRNNTAYAITCVESSDEEIVVVPSEYKGKPVKKLANLFFSYLNAYEIRIPESIDEFGTLLFDGSNISISYEYEGGYYIGNLKNPYMILIGIYEIPEDGKFVIHKDAKYIDTDVFSNRGDLVEIDIPDGVIAIGDDAFEDCKNLERVKLPDKIKCINCNTFSGCNKLSSINIPNSVEFICDNAFRNCSSLTGELKLSNNVKCIGWKSFGDVGLTNIVLGDGIIKIDSEFISSPNLRHDILNFYEGCYYIGSKNNPYKYLMFSNDEDVDTLKIHPKTTTIANRAFESENGKRMGTVDLRNNVEYIGEEAFSNNEIDNVILGDQIKVLDVDCFSRSHIKNITFPKKDFVAYDRAFAGNDFEELIIPKTLKFENEDYYNFAANNLALSYVEEYNLGGTYNNIDLFQSCEKLHKVSFEDGFDKIKNGMFSFCQSLEEVELLNGLKEIGKSAFYVCGLESIEIPGTVTVIGEGAFEYCDNLSEIYINEGVEVLEDRAFCLYRNTIRKISIPNSIKYIGAYSLPDYSQLEQVEGETTIEDNGILYVGNESNPHLIAYYLQDRDDALKIADGTKFIYSDFCEGQGEFVDVILPESLEFLCDNALGGIAISSQTITIPKRVRYIGEGSLSIQGLKHVIMLPETPPLVYDNNSLPMDCTVDIINGNSGTYESAMGWSGYGDGVIIERSITWLNFYNYTLALKRH